MSHFEESAESVPVQTVPFARGVIAGGKLYLHQWERSFTVLKTEGAAYRQIAKAGSTVFDLVRVFSEADAVTSSTGVSEVFVLPVEGAVFTPEIRQLLVDWADSVGYNRIWFDEGVASVELSGRVAFGSHACIECSFCRAETEDKSFQYWAYVAKYGRFPSQCQYCGSKSLPQATVASAKALVAAEPGAPSDLFTAEWDKPWDDGCESGGEFIGDGE